MSKPIIGVTGTFGSGKDTVADILEQDYNVLHVSTSDIVREKSMERHGSIERNPYLQETATYYRKEFGGDYFAREAYKRYEEQADTYAGAVITGIRSLGEARTIKELGGVLVQVDAPIEMRYERMIARKRDAETQMTLDEFRASEANERTGGDDDASFNIDKIGEMADVKIINDGTLDKFKEKVNKLAIEQGVAK
jgi:dephospho-CoA kinase